MNKRIFLLLFTTLFIFPGIEAQKLHKILFGHTTDRKIGKSVETDMARASNEIDAIGAYINYEVVPYIYPGDICSKENLEKLMTDLSISNNDIVVFYYSGHGAHAQGGLNDPWPQMCMNTPEFQEKYVPLHKVIETITAKNPHFALIMSDCCNNIDESGLVTVKGGLLKGAKDATTIEDLTKKNYQILFTQYKGVLPVTSSKLTQTSGGTIDDGGLFSMSFFDALYAGVNSTSTSWKSIMEETSKGTMEITNGKQEPTYDLSKIQNIGGGSASTPITTTTTTTVTPVATTTTPTGSTTSLLEQSLSQLLANPNIESRIASIPSVLQQCFSNSDVYIMTVGRNLTTVVDTENAKAFLRRIALDKNLVKINIIKESKDTNGKCSYAKVHEVRK